MEKDCPEEKAADKINEIGCLPLYFNDFLLFYLPLK
jgi:hypothetical protein